MKEIVYRDKRIDAVKGLLILCVVIAHYDNDVWHDFIFLFHMPIFFTISGYLMKEQTFSLDFLKKNVTRLLIPYACYMVLIFVLLDRDFAITRIFRMLWGGRALGGVYWYITCLFGAVLLFTFLRGRFTSKSTKFLIFVGGVIAVIEANFIDKIPFLSDPGVPWSLDTSLMAVVYIALGYYYKDEAGRIYSDKSHKYDFIALVSICILALLAIVKNQLNIQYYFDMKPAYYKDLILAVLVPILFAVIILRIVYYLNHLKNAIDGFATLGKITLPIMYLHIPLNLYITKYCAYGRIGYVIIGVVLPGLFAFFVSRWKFTSGIFGVEYRETFF